MQPISGNPNLLKEVNTNIVREKLRSLREATLQQLAAATGMSVVTVSAVIKKMLKKGEVIESGRIPSNGGRPSQLFVCNKDFSQIVIIYTHHLQGRDRASLRVYNLYDECLYEREYTIDNVCIEHFDMMLQEVLTRYPSIKAIGFSLPGEESGGKLTVIDYQNLRGLAFSRHFEEKYGLPVVLENDINAAVMGYSDHDTATECLVGIYFPKKYPAGAGILVNQKLVVGQRRFAGEISYLPMGFNWNQPQKQSREEMRDMAAKMVSTFACILAPARMVLYSELFDDEDITAIRENSTHMLEGLFSPNLVLSKEFAEDCQRGLMRLTFGLLDKGLIIKEKE